MLASLISAITPVPPLSMLSCRRLPRVAAPPSRRPDVRPQYKCDVEVKVIWRKFKMRRGVYLCCGKRVQGRQPMQTSDALGAAGLQWAEDRRNTHCGLRPDRARL